MTDFKLQFGNDIRRKSGPADLTYDGLKDIIVNTYLTPDANFDYKFKLAYKDSDEDWVTISNTDDLRLAFAHPEGEVLRIVVLGAQKIDLKAKAFKKAFGAGYQLLNDGQAEASIPHFVEALRVKKDPSTAYNLACAFSLLNQTDQALLWLETANDLGYRNFLWALRDPDLANVRAAEEEQFFAILAQMRSPWLRLTKSPRHNAATPTSTPTPARTASPAPFESSEEEVVVEEEETSSVETSPAPATPTPTPTPTPSQPDYSEALGQLAAMGFIDAEGNRQILAKNGGDLARSVHELLFA